MKVSKIPYIVYTETTQNPDAMRYVTDHVLVKNGKAYEFSTLAETKGAPIARLLLDFYFVKKVFIKNNYLTITKNEAAEWDFVAMELRQYVFDYLHNGGEILDEEIAISTDKIEVDISKKEIVKNETTSLVKRRELEAKKNQQKQVKAAEQKEIAKKINPILDKQIKKLLKEEIEPTADIDGGAAEFVSCIDGIVYLVFRGSYSNSPQAGALRNKIKAMLLRKFSEVKNVIVIHS